MALGNAIAVSPLVQVLASLALPRDLLHLPDMAVTVHRLCSSQVDLSSNNIGGYERGPKAIAEGIRASKTLKLIDLSHNKLGDYAKRADATSLDLSKQKLVAADAELLAAAMGGFMKSLTAAE
eukprot:3266490-Prymnesium_polylepis.1